MDMRWESDSDGTWRLIDADGTIHATVWENYDGTMMSGFTVDFSRDWPSKVFYRLFDAKLYAVWMMSQWRRQAIEELNALAMDT
jgi:hypothetical protein